VSVLIHLSPPLRLCSAPTEDTLSEDGDSASSHYESGNETIEDATIESNLTHSSSHQSSSLLHLQDSPQTTDLLSPLRVEGASAEQRSRASTVAASRGLNIAVGNKNNRNSRMAGMGLPVSPRAPIQSPRTAMPSPMPTAKFS
jgi:RalA-binding protein 1